MTKEDKEKIEKLKRDFHKKTPALFAVDGEVKPLRASFLRPSVLIYCKSASKKDRREFGEFLRDETDTLICKQYGGKKFAGDHTANIVKLANKASKDYGRILHKGRFRIGIAQKYLNLKLKGLWSLNKIEISPPHCPFDDIILNRILGCYFQDKELWTQSEGIPKYQKWVEAAKKEAKRLKYPDIAVWELAAYKHYRECGLPILPW